MSIKKTTSNALVVSLTAVVLLGITLAAWLLLSPTAGNYSPDPLSPTATSATVPNLDGDWSETTNGIVLIATIKSDTILIQLKNEGTTITYWKGTFISNAKPGQQVASIKDATTAIFNSSDTKIFTIDGNTISFEMSAMGVTKTVVLSHV